MKELVTRIRLESKEFISDMTSAKGSALALSAAVAGVAATIGGLAIHAAEVIDKNTLLARSAGEATDRFSAMSYAMKLGGIDAESLAAGMAKMAKPEQQKNLVGMGIAVTDLNGKLRSQTDVMLDLAGVIEKTQDPLRRLQIAQAALGKSGGQFIEALKDGPAALRALMTEADQLGQVFSKQDAVAADQFNDNLDRLKSGISGVGIEIGKSIVQWVNHSNVMEYAVNIVKGVIAGWRSMDQTTKEFIYTFGVALVAVSALAGAIYGIVTLAPLVSAAIKAAFVSNPIGLVLIAVSLLAAAVIYMKNNWEDFAQFFAPITQMFRQFRTVITDVAATVINGFSRMGSAVSPLKDTFASIGKAFENVNLVSTGLKVAMAPLLITFYALATVVNVLITAFSAMFEIMKTPVGEGLLKFMLGSTTGNIVMMAEGIQKVGQGWEQTKEIVDKASTEMGKSLKNLSTNVSQTVNNIITKSKPAADAIDNMFSGREQKFSTAPLETYGNEFYKIYEATQKAAAGFAALRAPGADFVFRMQSAAAAIEGVKGVLGGLGGQFVQLQQAMERVAQAKLKNFTQNFDFMIGGISKMLDLQLAAETAGYDKQIKALQNQKDALLAEEKRYQEDLQAIKDAYASQRKTELDAEVQAEIQRLDAQYAMQVKYLEDSGVTGTELESRKADMLAQIEAQKNQAISESQKRLQNDITARNDDLDAEAKVRSEAQKTREDDLAMHIQMIEDQKAAASQATADKKQQIERGQRIFEWAAGRSAFEVGKRAQIAGATASTAMAVLNAIQAGLLIAANYPFVGWVLGPVMGATFSALALAAGARSIQAIASSQYPPPPLFGDGGMSTGLGIIGDKGPEIAMPMNNPGKDFGALKGELASQLADAAGGALGGTHFSGPINLNVNNQFDKSHDYQEIKEKISIDLREMIKGVIESVR